MPPTVIRIALPSSALAPERRLVNVAVRGPRYVILQWQHRGNAGRLKCVTKQVAHHFGRCGHVVSDWIFFLTRCDEPTDAVHLPVGP